MRQTLTTFIIIILSCNYVFAESNMLWHRVDSHDIISKGKQLLTPSKYFVYSLAEDHLKQQLYRLPYEPGKNQILLLPLPDGTFRRFVIWQTHIMEPLLEAKYASIKTFTAYAEDDPRVTAKIDMTPRGFHAMIFEPGNISFIDPYSDTNDGYYTCYYKRDYKRADGRYMHCCVNDDIRANRFNGAGNFSSANMRLVNGNQLRKFRLALACTGEYAQAVAGATPTESAVLNAMVTTLNRVNGVYERELAITMQLVNNEDTLIFLAPGTYNNTLITVLYHQNQDTVDRRIGNANYDIGHIFCTSSQGGVSALGCVCIPNQKATSASGALSPTGDAYDIDFVAHEMGHEFGADHSFNDNSSGACSGNAEFTQAYEPGSGSTIMCYAGFCTGDNLQPHSDAYFHGISLQTINEYMMMPIVATCLTYINSGNKPVQLPAFSTSYTIPYLTAFELTAPAAIDSVADTLNTYCWEEWDRGDFGQSFANTHAAGPIFRSFSPDISKTRIFPRLDTILQGTLNYLGEKVPDVARILNFKLTVRDIYNGIGCIHVPDDSIRLQVVNTGKPFKVTNPDTAVNWKIKTTAIITWDIAQTNVAPISCDSVNIYLSTDGGYTYPYLLAKAVNNGTVSVQVPNIVTTTARIKIKGVNNVFFDISDKNFTIDSISQQANTIVLYPVPANKASNRILYVRLGNMDSYEYAVYNMPGQKILNGQARQQFNIDVNGLASGVYVMKLRNTLTGDNTVKLFVVE